MIPNITDFSFDAKSYMILFLQEDKRMKKLTSILLALAMVLCLAACGEKPEEKVEDNTDEKTEVKEQTVILDTQTGLKITVNDGIVTSQQEGYDLFAFDQKNDKCALTVLKESFEIFQEYGYDTDSMTVEEYADLVSQSNGGITFNTNEFGDLFSTYDAEVEGTNYSYYSCVFKGTDAFWLITYFCHSDDVAEYYPIFAQWNHTVELY